MSENVELATVTWAARVLRVPAQWLRSEALAQRIPHVRAGRQILVDLPTVERVLADRAKTENYTEETQT